MLSVSVVICAHADDRWDDTLGRRGLGACQSHPAKELIVVVDYNPSLHQRLKAELPDATVIENREQQGLSGARTRGSQASTGQVVAFLDDDAVADVNWLKCLLEPTRILTWWVSADGPCRPGTLNGRHGSPRSSTG